MTLTGTQAARPFIMVAPNGGRKTKLDHPALPITPAELAHCARECRAVGADTLHLHIRDAAGGHTLDAGLYREVLNEIETQAPGFDVQITTEALGRYSAQDQRQLVRELGHKRVSIALREQQPDHDPRAARDFYHWAAEAGIEIQHILYSPGERAWLERLQAAGTLPDAPQRVLYVLGRYQTGVSSDPVSIRAFLGAGTRPVRWMVCAFGQAETACLTEAHRLGGEMRVGFENNLLNADGEVAQDNADRVRDLLLRL
ncbi:MAG: 3-keto-5-aminohexanoate cleavage protein [Pseudomonadota bacterium]